MTTNRLCPEDLQAIIEGVSSNQDFISSIASQLRQVLSSPAPPQGENEQDQQHSSGSQSQPTTENQGRFAPLSSWHAQNSMSCPGYPTLHFSSPTRLKESEFLRTSSELVTLGLAEDLVFDPSLRVSTACGKPLRIGPRRSAGSSILPLFC